jgi:hypothetical protein
MHTAYQFLSGKQINLRSVKSPVDAKYKQFPGIVIGINLVLGKEVS